MIYLVTTNEKLFNTGFEVISVQDSLSILNNHKILQLDTETEGLDCHSKRLLTVQIGTKDFQIVIDCTTIDILNYKPILEDPSILYILWNAKFDLKFFFKAGIILRNLWDGFLAEKLLYMGYPLGYKENSLKWAGKHYLNIELDKSIRGEIASQGITPRVIEYAASDVKYLEDIMNIQKEEITKRGSLKAMSLENRFVIPLAYMEYCGVKINKEKWTKKAEQDSIELEEALRELDNWLYENPLFSHLTFDDIFGGKSSVINWSSTKQVVPIFKKIGVDTQVFDKETKKFKDSLEAKVLKPQKDKSTLVSLFLNYKKKEKLCSTYGVSVLNQINPNTGRIHANFNQLNTVTGRLSSGGKDVLTGQESMNLQNLPADELTRSCFIAEENNVWLSADYVG